MSPSGLPRIAAVIVHHGDPALTVRALEAARASRGVDLLVAVVDNGPGPGDVLAAACRAAGVRWVRPGTNTGFAGGANRGIEEARRAGGRDLFLVLNGDVVLAPDAAAILAGLAADPAVGVAGPALLDARHPDRVWNAGSDIEWPGARPRSRAAGEPADGLPAAPFDVGYVCGCAAMAGARALDRIGPWDESYFLYFEDADLSFRARRAGLRAVVDPRARALHAGGAAAGRARDLAEYCRVRSRILFSRRWAPPGPGPRLARLAFALRRMARGGPARRGAVAGLLGRPGPPPADLFPR